MSAAADHHAYHEGDWYDVDQDGSCAHLWDRSCLAHGCNGAHLDQPAPGVHPADVHLLDGAAPDALFALEHIRDVPAEKVPAAVMVQAVLGAQRLVCWAKAQAMYWTAALARPDVAVPVADVLESLAHRNQEPGSAGDLPDEVADRAAAGTRVAGDQVWDALLAAEAASAAEPELSAAWLVAPITARRRIADALELVDELPGTFQALEEGRIEEVRARIIAETTAGLDPGLRRRAETLILDRAKRGMCPGDLRRLATKVVADLDPDAAHRRAERARARRGTGVRDLGDDLGRFTADLAVEDAALTQAVLDLLATAIPPEARHGRGISQLRADIFADLFGELADTGLIDLRGINPNNNPDPTRTDPTRTDAGHGADEHRADGHRPAQPADTDTATEATDTEAAPTATDTTGMDDDPSAPADPAQAGATDRGSARPDLVEPSDADADNAATNTDNIDADAAHAATEAAEADVEQEGDTAPGGPETTDAEEAAVDSECPATQPDAGEPGQPPQDDSAQRGLDQGDPNSSPTEPELGTSSPADSTGAVDADPPDPAGCDPDPDPDPDPDGDRSAPTFAELLTRLRSIDWESRPDPDCERRGGLLSLVRLPAGVRVNLDVTVALSTLAGCDDLSARLAGLGVITADTARALAKAAGTVRILVTNDPPGPPNGSPPHTPAVGECRLPVDPIDPDRPTAQHNGGIHHDSPDCGTVLDFGRTAYRPPATVIDRVDTRDQRCRFPGCPQIALRCDHDHRITWDDGGATCPCDLDALCRFHHRAKTFTAWTAIRDHHNNTLTWTSPLGRTHVDRPAPDLPTGTPMNLNGTGTGNLGGKAPAVGDAVPDLTAETDPPPVETEEQEADSPGDRDSDEPPF